ncbi:phosphatidylglycerophosphate phosphatase 1, chloroplastic/mitochondrial isoform X2 [Pyrus x bretschneideri]|uniref:phosphatidylglycerophosphate phosphatase 1, chloroplastic/mitochondrial isoform X2 n=1 Tax=Pyrus x bretschneideri TaxID=225117 RepID=UPI00202EE5F7|nr:phosphatidylglycerophosphate phosphatase 1, chloroplastic/mitochondrial isoform X2 [Pyrus x bretschneideri]
MQSTSSALLRKCSYPLPLNHFLFHFHHRHPCKTLNFLPLPLKPQTHSANHCALSISHTNSCSREHQEQSQKHTNGDSDRYQNELLFLQLNSSGDTEAGSNQSPEAPNDERGRDQRESEADNSEGLLTNMWWADVKAALGQRFNFGAIVRSVMVLTKDKHLALPHVSVPDVRYIDWPELHRRGFKGVVFDKDNTITAPYSLTLWGPLGSSLEQCKSVFGPDIAVFSNSAGLYEYDHDGSKARELEGAVGIKVIRHRVKKPAGTSEEIEKHFGCKSSHLIMVGDRPFTDIVYGNQNGFLTILTEPLSLNEEPFIVRQVRKLETSLVIHWFKKGLKPTSHRLLPDGKQCVKHPPPLLQKNRQCQENYKPKISTQFGALMED